MSNPTERIGDSVNARWEAALRDLQHLCTERPESATEAIETLNRYLLNGGELSSLRLYVNALVALRPVPVRWTVDQYGEWIERPFGVGNE